MKDVYMNRVILNRQRRAGEETMGKNKRQIRLLPHVHFRFIRLLPPKIFTPSAVSTELEAD